MNCQLPLANPKFRASDAEHQITSIIAMEGEGNCFEKEKLELQEEVFPPSHHLNQYVNRISKSSVVTLIRTCFQMASLQDRSDKNRYYIQTVRTHVTAKLKANNWKGSVEKV